MDIKINYVPLKFIIIDATNAMNLYFPVCDKPNKSLAFWLHKQDIALELCTVVNMLDFKHTMSLHPFLESQHHAW
jgi:hypothetical protein